MPVKLREKRRSLHITSTGRFTELAKEVALRPQSWYLASGNIDLDPYTSVRKIFYEFPKKAFYGEITSDIKDEVITNGYTSSNTEVVIKYENQRNLNNSFVNLNIKTPPSPVPSHKSLKSECNDTNNNIASPSKSKSNLLHLPYFSSKTSDVASLKEESSSYADFYVPNATKKSHNNFLKRNHIKRRSYDPSKLKQLEKQLENNRKTESDNEDTFSVTSCRSAGSCKYITNRRSCCDFSKLKNIDKLSEAAVSDNVFSSTDEISSSNMDSSSPAKSPLKLAEVREVTGVSETSNCTDDDENPMMTRFLRDANVNICQGVYPVADDSVLFQHENIISTLKLANKEQFIPWNKRLSFSEAISSYLEENTTTEVKSTFNNRRNSKRFSSLRFSRVKDGNTLDKFNPSRRLSGNFDNTLRSSKSFASLRRHHSESGSATIKKKKMNSTLSLNKDYTLPRDAPRSLRRKSNKMEAPEFFKGYQDKLRECVFSIDSQTTDCKTTSSLRGVYEYISKAFEAKLLGKTYQQLFYIRSRLSVQAQKSQFLCDGYYGCELDISKTTPHWV